MKLSPAKILQRWMLSITIFNSLLFILLSLKYQAYIDLTNSPLQWFYIMTTSIGHMGLIPLIAVVFPLLLSLIYKNKKVLLLLCSAFNSLAIIYLIVDYFIFSQYRFHLNRFVLDMLLGGAAKDIFQFSNFMYFVAIFSIIALFALESLVGWWLWKKQIFMKLNPRNILLVLLGLMITSQLSHAAAAANSYSPITKTNNIFPLYFPLTANSLCKKLHLIDPNIAKSNKIPQKEHENKSIKYPTKPLQFTKSPKHNILFIVIDCWRSDCLDSLVTPNIYQFAQKSSVFKNHYSGSNGTRGSIFSMFYGLPSFAYWNTMKNNQTRPALMETLAKQNYQFGIFGSASLTYPAFNETVFAGIKNLRLSTNSENQAPYAKDAKITEEWLKFMNSNYKTPNEQPFLGFLFFDAAHGYSHPNAKEAPFQPSWTEANYLTLNNDTDPTPFLNLFKNSLNYIDDQVGKVLKNLNELGVLDNTIVVITGDHGQEFNDNKKNYWGHGSNFSEFQLHIPLVVYWPKKSPQIYSHRTSHFDIAPTLLSENQGSINKMTDYSIGKALWTPSSSRYYIAGSEQNYAVIEKDQITTVLYGNYSITTPHLESISDNNLRSDVIFNAMKDSYRFYTN
jgi:membrane-anchored protein YejM (alkaline phosphatase superfamily)